MNRKYLVTIDREEWSGARRWEFWKAAWHIERQRDFEKIQGIGRTVFEVDRDTGECRALFQLPQLLDPKVLREAWNEQSAWTKSITRGLRAITPLADGSLVVNDIFGVYHTTREGKILNYVTSERFSDVHCGTPNRDNSMLILASTGTEEVLLVDWSGRVHQTILLPDLFELPVSPRVEREFARHPDRRSMRLDHSRELFHVNWAEWIIEEESILVSCHQPGLVLVIDVASGQPHIAKQWGYFPQCHGPSLLGDDALFVSVSKTDEVIEVDPVSGKRRWTTRNMGFSKRVTPLGDNRVLACDCNGKRLVEIDRSNGKIVWECALPGLPYSVAVEGSESQA